MLALTFDQTRLVSGSDGGGLHGYGTPTGIQLTAELLMLMNLDFSRL